MPLSYHGFGPVAILLMLASVVISSLYRMYREKHRTHSTIHPK